MEYALGAKTYCHWCTHETGPFPYKAYEDSLYTYCTSACRADHISMLYGNRRQRRRLRTGAGIVSNITVKNSIFYLSKIRTITVRK